MKGFVPTPSSTVDSMVQLLFGDQPPSADDRVLDPGSGEGAFVEGILRWCASNQYPVPRITAVDSDPHHIEILQHKFGGNPDVDIRFEDFLTGERREYEYVIGNPPYVGITGLSPVEKAQYRKLFATARGRFDLYMLFFEQSLKSLTLGGRLVFITPEKFMYVDSAGPLRQLLSRHHVESIQLAPEDTFGDLVTYPTITSVRNIAAGETHIRRRDGSCLELRLPRSEASWLPLLADGESAFGDVTLGNVCLRVSCGVATGADSVFVLPAHKLDPALREFARATIAGRELVPGNPGIPERNVMVLPYDQSGHLLPFDQLGGLRDYLSHSEVRSRLLARSCVPRKPWYSFHETPVLRDMLRPKILFKDISAKPEFWVDWSGEVVPRHSVYYLVPQCAADLPLILDYLRSPEAGRWMEANCQRATKGYLRLQSRVLQRMPLPQELVSRLAVVVPPESLSRPTEAAPLPTGEVIAL
ncbi:MAG: Eco57I restriction-modification methylase domain-containing protein [Coriobacteriia bacterium]